MAQGKGYQGPRQRGHAGPLLGGYRGYQGPSWDKYIKKKKKKPDGTEADDGSRGTSKGKIMEVGTAILGAYMGGG